MDSKIDILRPEKEPDENEKEQKTKLKRKSQKLNKAHHKVRTYKAKICKLKEILRNTYNYDNLIQLQNEKTEAERLAQNSWLEVWDLIKTS